MCRRTQILSFATAALGAGFLISCFISSVLLRTIIGIALLALGILSYRDH